MTLPAVASPRVPAAWPLYSVMPPMGALTGAPGSARAHVNAVLSGWRAGQAMAETCALVVTELVTNALRASTTAEGSPRYLAGRMAVIRVRLCSDGRRVLVEVCDQAAGRPVMRQADLDAESGRGLLMVHALAGGRWGWYGLRGMAGKCVWAELRPD